MNIATIKNLNQSTQYNSTSNFKDTIEKILKDKKLTQPSYFNNNMLNDKLQLIFEAIEAEVDISMNITSDLLNPTSNVISPYAKQFVITLCQTLVILEPQTKLTPQNIQAIINKDNTLDNDVKHLIALAISYIYNGTKIKINEVAKYATDFYYLCDNINLLMGKNCDIGNKEDFEIATKIFQHTETKIISMKSKTGSIDISKIYRLFYTNGDQYIGQQNENNQPHGNGQMIFNNGDFYLGEFKNGYTNGKGILKYINGNIYQGEFNGLKINGIPEGYGTLIYSNHCTLTSTPKYGASSRNYAALAKDSKNKEYFLINWQDHIAILNFITFNQYLLNGKITQANNNYYIKHSLMGALFKNYKAKLEYTGKFFETPTGSGTLKYANGDIYTGKFKFGEPNGQGKLINQTGKIIHEGKFYNGQPQKF